MAGGKPKSKYRAVRTNVDGIVFASKKEARRYCDLKILECAGEIRDLELQPAFPFSINGRKVTFPSGRQAKYIADFAYFDVVLNRRVVLDVKGMKTEIYKLKKAIVEAMFPDVVIEEC